MNLRPVFLGGLVIGLGLVIAVGMASADARNEIVTAAVALGTALVLLSETKAAKDHHAEQAMRIFGTGYIGVGSLVDFAAPAGTDVPDWAIVVGTLAALVVAATAVAPLMRALEKQAER